MEHDLYEIIKLLNYSILKKIWKMLRNKKKSINKKADKQDNTRKVDYKRGFRNLYQGSSEDMKQLEANENSNRIMVEDEYYDIILRDVKEVMKNSKNRKTSLDSITNEM